MIKFLHDLDLSLDSFLTIRFKQLELLIDLTSDLLIGVLVKTNSDQSIGSFTYSLAYQIVV